jgi:tetratricopeptide (TPR) repeat protein
MAADLDRRRGDFGASERTYRESIGLCRALGDRIGMGTALKGLGQSLLARGDLRAAERRLREAVDAYLAGNDPLGGASAMLPLAQVLLEEGRPDEALPYARRAVERLREMRADASGLTSDETLSLEAAQRLLDEIRQRLDIADNPSEP